MWSLVGLILLIFFSPWPFQPLLNCVPPCSCHSHPISVVNGFHLTRLLSSHRYIQLDTCGVPLQNPLGHILHSGHFCIGQPIPCRLWSDEHSFQGSEAPNSLSLPLSDTACFLSWTYLLCKTGVAHLHIHNQKHESDNFWVPFSIGGWEHKCFPVCPMWLVLWHIL